MLFLTLKQLHITAVMLSGSLFALRGVWMLTESPLLRRRWVKIVPHLIDTVLLTSAIALTVLSQQYPIEQSWLTAKVTALVIYILLGTLALKRGRTRTIRTLALIGAILAFSYIVAVAIERTPLPF